MKRRTTIAFRLGYARGAKAGPHHYEELRRLAVDVVRSDAFQAMLTKVRDVLAAVVAAITGRVPWWAASEEAGTVESPARSLP